MRIFQSLVVGLLGITAGGQVLLAAPSADQRLLDAMKNRDTTAIQALLKAKVDVKVKSADGTTSLHWAAQWNDVNTAAELIRAGADVNATTDLGVRPLALACLNGSSAMVTALIKAGADANSAGNTGETALMTCSRSGNLAAVEALLAKGADVNGAESSSGQNALMWAAARDHADIVKLLIAKGANVHSATKGAGFTPLLFAAREGSMEATKVLLEVGADVNKSSTTGTSPLVAATFTANWDLAKFLLDHGANANQADSGFSALHWAAGSWENDISGNLGPDGYEWIAGRGPGKLEMVNSLLAHGADPNARLQKRPPRYGYGSGSRLVFKGATPFILAALGGESEIMSALLKAGADPKLTTDDGTTALMTAAGFGRIHGESRAKDDESLEAVKIALGAGIDINAANAIGETALHAAAYFQTNPTVSYLIEHGANVNALNKRGETPLVLAEGFSGNDTGGNTFYSDATAEILRKAGGVNVMEFSSVVVQLESACPSPTFLVADPTSGDSADRSFASSYGSALRIRPTDSLQFKNSTCEDLKPAAKVRITGGRLGHHLDKNGQPWDGSVDGAIVEVIR